MTKAKKNRFKNLNKRTFFAFPYVAVSVIFVIIPLILVFVYAFRARADGSFTLTNFSEFFLAGNTWRMIGRSFAFAFLATFFCLVICYPLALALLRFKNKTAVLVMLFILPMWINTLLRIYAVRMLLGDIIGESFQLALIGMVYDFFPFMLLPIYTILANTDNSYMEAAGDLGASPVRALLKVRLPLSLPGIISGCIMVFMPTISSFVFTDILGGLNHIIGNEIYSWFGINHTYNSGAPFVIVLMLIVGAIMLITTFLTKGRAQESRMGGLA